MLKEKLLICLLLCFGLCFTSSCNKNISSTLLTEDISTDLPDQSIDEVFIQSSTSNQSELPVHSGDDKMVNNCKLVVRGEDITCGNYVKLNENYAELPFTAVMKCVGSRS